MDFVGGTDALFFILQVSLEVQNFAGVSDRSLRAAEVEKLEKRTVNPNDRIVVSWLLCGKGCVLLPTAFESGSSELAMIEILLMILLYDLAITETLETYSCLSVIKVGSQERGLQRHQPLGINSSPCGICIFNLWLPLG